MGDIVKSSGSGLAADNKLKMSEFRKNILDSGVCEMLLQMALTGREYFLDPVITVDEKTGKETQVLIPRFSNDESGMISQTERLKLMTMLVNKVLPVIKEGEEEQEQKSLLADLAKKMSRE